LDLPLFQVFVSVSQGNYVTEAVSTDPTDTIQHTLGYQDVVVVNPLTGKVNVVATGFGSSPLAILANDKGVLVADTGAIRQISATASAVPIHPAPASAIVFVVGAMIKKVKTKKSGVV
jgi:streptogramin lyase